MIQQPVNSAITKPKIMTGQFTYFHGTAKRGNLTQKYK
jgi:hypothetical protein